MKKDYESPQMETIEFSSRELLDVISMGGSGNPDAKKCGGFDEDDDTSLDAPLW